MVTHSVFQGESDIGGNYSAVYILLVTKVVLYVFEVVFYIIHIFDTTKEMTPTCQEYSESLFL